MIFQSARIIVIDDDERHLKALDRAITQLGSACLSFHYVDDEPTSAQLDSARVIFCDLHLGSDTLTTDRKAHYSRIVSMLAGRIAEDHGPYLLILWSQYEEDARGLGPYLDELKPGQRPFYVGCLDKNRYIDIQTGDPRGGADLPGAVESMVRSKPGLAAMLAWEQMVARGAWKTTSTLWQLCSDLGVDQDQALRRTLGKLAIGVAGPESAEKRPGNSVREGLAPLLVDQLSAAAVDETLWSRAVQFGVDSGAASSHLYTALHFEMSSQYTSMTRGVASVLPKAWCDDRYFERKFGFTPEAVLGTCGYQEDNLEHALEGVSWYLVQINAACDEGRDTPGYLPYCLAATVPTTRQVHENEVPLKINGKQRISVERSREIVINGQVVWLFLFGRFILGMTIHETTNLVPVFRIRSSLLDKFIQEIRYTSARLGVAEP